MKDADYMGRALELSRRGRPSPNPYVGAVVVKNGRMIAGGFHRRAGMPHAECEALRRCRNPKGATLYVTVEPCSHYGRTPPCTDAIIKAGIREVVYGMEDPNRVVCGREKLRDAGVRVRGGVLREEVERLNEAFVKYMKTGLPYVTLKAAMTLDGKIATVGGASKWITSEGSRRRVQELRDSNDAVLVGVNTVLRDDPRLTCRLRGGRDPLRVILDSRLRIPLNAKVLKDGNVVVATTRRHDKRKLKRLREKAEVWILGRDKVDFRGLMAKLGRQGISTVLIEGGGRVNASALKAGVVDKLILFIAPKVIGGDGIPVFGGVGVRKLKDAVRVGIESVEKTGTDLVVVARPQR